IAAPELADWARRLLEARAQLWLRGTNFQIKVWKALLRVPPGAVTSYGRLALLAGSTRAARAAGSAVGANPIAVLIPCHRVIRDSGALGECLWGKAALIGREAAWAEQEKARLVTGLSVAENDATTAADPRVAGA
ncbi:MAG: MGMT family protein, partial [Burkholderiaceae bacterium]